MWECKELKLKAVHPQCEYLATRPTAKEILASRGESGWASEAFLLPIRPKACTHCREGRAIRRRKGRG